VATVATGLRPSAQVTATAGGSMPDLFVALGVVVHDVSRHHHGVDDPRSSRRRRGGLSTSEIPLDRRTALRLRGLTARLNL
jgi:hypothetical protein